MDYRPPPAFGAPDERPAPLFVAPPLSGTPSGGDPSSTRRPLTPLSRASTAVSIGVLVLAALVVVVLVLIFRVSGGAPQRHIGLPDAAGDLHLMRAINGPTAAALLGSQVGTLGPLAGAVSTAKVGVYGAGSSPSALFLGFDRADSAAVDSLLRSGSASAIAGELLSGARPSSAFDPGPFGGSLRCSSAGGSIADYTPCAWVDGSTVALVLLVGEVETADAARVALRFRAAAEH